jgi:hypothetical protein
MKLMVFVKMKNFPTNLDSRPRIRSENVGSYFSQELGNCHLEGRKAEDWASTS